MSDENQEPIQGIPVGKSLDEFKTAHAPEPEVVYLRKRVEELEKVQKQDKLVGGEIKEKMLALESAILMAEPKPMVFVPEPHKGSPNTYVLHLTDLHYGEVVDKDEIDGFNKYNPEIAERRLQALGNNVIRQVGVLRNGFNIPHLHILGTADYISGDIHYELMVTNAFPTPVQATGCGYALGALVEMLAPHFETVTFDLITLDNHGRITHKYQQSEGGMNNWSYVVASVAQQYCKKLPNVKVNIHAKPSALIAIGPEKYLCFHGHQMKGWAGKPYYGFDRRVAMEAVKRMGQPDAGFTKLIFGHFHTATNEPDWQLGGSLSGTTAFDHAMGRHCEAHQTSWIVHPTHGEWCWTRWWLGHIQ